MLAQQMAMQQQMMQGQTSRGTASPNIPVGPNGATPQHGMNPYASMGMGGFPMMG